MAKSAAQKKAEALEKLKGLAGQYGLPVTDEDTAETLTAAISKFETENPDKVIKDGETDAGGEAKELHYYLLRVDTYRADNEVVTRGLHSFTERQPRLEKTAGCYLGTEVPTSVLLKYAEAKKVSVTVDGKDRPNADILKDCVIEHA